MRQRSRRRTPDHNAIQKHAGDKLWRCPPYWEIEVKSQTCDQGTVGLQRGGVRTSEGDILSEQRGDFDPDVGLLYDHLNATCARLDGTMA